MSEAPECRLVKWALCVGVALVMWAASNTPGMFTRQTNRDGSSKKTGFFEPVWCGVGRRAFLKSRKIFEGTKKIDLCTRIDYNSPEYESSQQSQNIRR